MRDVLPWPHFFRQVFPTSRFHAFWCFAARLWVKFHANESFFGASVQRLWHFFPCPLCVHHGSNIVARHPWSEDCATHESNAVPWLSYQKHLKTFQTSRQTESNSFGSWEVAQLWCFLVVHIRRLQGRTLCINKSPVETESWALQRQTCDHLLPWRDTLCEKL